MGGDSIAASPSSGGCGGILRFRGFCPAAATFAPRLTKKSGVAQAQPGWGQRPGSSAGSPGCFPAELLSCPPPHGPCSAQGGERGQPGAEAPYRGIAIARWLQRLHWHPQGRISGAPALASAPPTTSGTPLASLQTVLSSFCSFNSRCVCEIDGHCSYTCVSARVAGSVPVRTAPVPLCRQ